MVVAALLCSDSDHLLPPARLHSLQQQQRLAQDTATGHRRRCLRLLPPTLYRTPLLLVGDYTPREGSSEGGSTTLSNNYKQLQQRTPATASTNTVAVQQLDITARSNNYKQPQQRTPAAARIFSSGSSTAARHRNAAVTLTGGNYGFK